MLTCLRAEHPIRCSSRSLTAEVSPQTLMLTCLWAELLNQCSSRSPTAEVSPKTLTPVCLWALTQQQAGSAPAVSWGPSAVELLVLIAKPCLVLIAI